MDRNKSIHKEQISKLASVIQALIEAAQKEAFVLIGDLPDFYASQRFQHLLRDWKEKEAEKKEVITTIAALKKQKPTVDINGTLAEKEDQLFDLDHAQDALESDIKYFLQQLIFLCQCLNEITNPTEKIQQIGDFVETGKFQPAQQLFNWDSLYIEAKKLLDEKQETSTKRQQKANECLLLAQLLLLNEKKQAERFYQVKALSEIAISLNKNALNVRAYAHFLYTHHLLKESIPFYEEALHSYRLLATESPDHLPYLARVLNQLAFFSSTQLQYEQAETYAQEALNIYQTLAAQQAEKYTDQVAKNLNSLGLLQVAKQAYPKASECYIKSLDLYKNMIVKDLDAYQADVSGCLNNRGILLYQQQKKEQAIDVYQDALAIYQELAVERAERFLPDVAISLNNIGQVYWSMKDDTQAIFFFTQALNVYQQLASTHPARYLADVAVAWNLLAQVYIRQNKPALAEEALLNSLAIRRRLLVKNISIHTPALAETLIHLSHFYQKSKIDKSQSLAYLDEAIKYLLPFHKNAYIKNYLYQASQIIKDWGLDVKTYLTNILGKENS